MPRTMIHVALALTVLAGACGDADDSGRPEAALEDEDPLERPGGPDDEATVGAGDAQLAQILDAANHPLPEGQVVIVDVEGDADGELLVVLTLLEEAPPTNFAEELGASGYRVLDERTDPVSGVYFGPVEESILACGVWLEVAVLDPLETHLFSRRSPAESEDECQDIADSGLADLRALAEQQGFST